MISYWRLRNRLNHEWVRLQTQELPTPSIQGMIEGLKLAAIMAKEQFDAEQGHTSYNPTGKRRRAQ